MSSLCLTFVSIASCLPLPILTRMRTHGHILHVGHGSGKFSNWIMYIREKMTPTLLLSRHWHKHIPPTITMKLPRLQWTTHLAKTFGWRLALPFASQQSLGRAICQKYDWCLAPWIIHIYQHTAQNCYPQENVAPSMFFYACHNQKLVFFVHEHSLCSVSEGLPGPLVELHLMYH